MSSIIINILFAIKTYYSLILKCEFIISIMVKMCVTNMISKKAISITIPNCENKLFE
jgi:hypothetical protein